jgi:hypothetical protein
MPGRVSTRSPSNHSRSETRPGAGWCETSGPAVSSAVRTTSRTTTPSARDKATLAGGGGCKIGCTFPNRREQLGKGMDWPSRVTVGSLVIVCLRPIRAAACDSPDGQHDALAAADEMPRQRASDVSTPMIAVVMAPPSVGEHPRRCARRGEAASPRSGESAGRPSSGPVHIRSVPAGALLDH